MISTKRKPAAKKPAAQTRTAGRTPEVNLEAVAQRAYEKFQARGGVHGNDLQDWLEAEQELKAEQARGRR